MDLHSTGAMRWNSFGSRCGSVAVRRSRAHTSAPAPSMRQQKGSSVTEAFQSYVNMVTGVTKSTQAKAAATARALLKQAGLEEVATEASERVTKLAEEIMNASRTNRELWQHFVAAEVDKTAARLGFARADEVEALRDEVASLRAQLKEATAHPAKSAPTRKAATNRAAAKKAAATMTATKKTTATTSASPKPPREAAPSADSSSQSGEK